MQVVRTTKEIVGFEPAVGVEWDAGYLPHAPAHRRVRVSVRKDADSRWTVYAKAYRGAITLAEHDLAVLDCEACAKALALSVVFPNSRYSCVHHNRKAVSESAIFHGLLSCLVALMGIDASTWATLDEGSRHRCQWVVRLIMNGEIDLLRAIRAWEAAEEFAKELSLSLNEQVSWWYNEISK